jgi:naphtho-gamma-pyrone polyketide synthase
VLDRYYGEGSRPYPNAVNSYVLGLCTGSYAAAAISTSRTISELIPAAIEVVLVAFRTALHSLELRNDIERPSKGSSQSWSVVVSTPEASAIKMIKTFSEAKVFINNSIIVIPKADRQCRVYQLFPHHTSHL